MKIASKSFNKIRRAINKDINDIKSVLQRSPKVEMLSGDGADYRGFQNKTASGNTCQAWNRNYPQNHRLFTSKNRNTKGLGYHNYCRNPDGEPTIWCYTTNPRVRFERCLPLGAKVNATFFGPEVVTGDGASYRGQQNKTISGRTCQAWSS